ncbi:MAG: hypothetical protein QOE77_3303 [Blastocatellia bacterium]|nr:hypothetical protein [Blastocatellia bacterium]
MSTLVGRVMARAKKIISGPEGFFFDDMANKKSLRPQGPKPGVYKSGASHQILIYYKGEHSGPFMSPSILAGSKPAYAFPDIFGGQMAIG